MSQGMLSSPAEEGAMGYYDVIQPVDGDASYDGDFAAWAFDQARRLRVLKSNDIDVANLAEEIEDLGKSVVSRMESLIRIILVHLLKWDHQPLFRSASWEISINRSRRELIKHLKKHPSLKAIRDAAVVDVYEDARFAAAEETGMSLKHFPENNPYSWDQIMTREVSRMDPEL